MAFQGRWVPKFDGLGRPSYDSVLPITVTVQDHPVDYCSMQASSRVAYFSLIYSGFDYRLAEASSVVSVNGYDFERSKFATKVRRF